jgi:hypothetical protein
MRTRTASTPITNLQGLMAGFLRLQRRTTAAMQVVAAARRVDRERMDVDETTYVGLLEHVEALHDALAAFDHELAYQERDPAAACGIEFR